MNEDNKLRSLLGQSIYVGNVEVRPKTLNEIMEVGYSKYMEMAGLLSLSLEKVIPPEMFVDIQRKNLTVYEVIFSIYEEDFQNIYRKALEYFVDLKLEMIDPETRSLVFEGEDKIFSPEDFKEFVRVIQEQNQLDINGAEVEDKYKPANDKAAEIAAKFKKGKELVKEAAKSNSSKENITFYSIIDAVSSKSNSINKLNVGELTLFQLYAEYKRLSHIDVYELNNDAIMQGAEIKNNPHWSAEISDD